MSGAASAGEEAIPQTVLVTGGAGFVGSHLTDALLARGARVRVLDALSEAQHGPERAWPGELDPRVERVRGDVRDAAQVRGTLEDVDAVVHLAAHAGPEIGTHTGTAGIEDLVSANMVGTAVLLEALAERPVARLVVASSASVYGEGLYATLEGWPRSDVARDREALARGDWEPRDDAGRCLRALPTPEDKHVDLVSIHALTKHDQERLCLLAGEAHGIPTVALRLFDVYGPRQTRGVVAGLAARILAGQAPVVLEDGEQRRDLVSVHDVVRAIVLALGAAVSGVALNIGSGLPVTLRELARRLARALGRRDLEAAHALQEADDVRHCFASLTRARRLLGYEPRVSLVDGLAELAAWLRGPSMRRGAPADAGLAGGRLGT